LAVGGGNASLILGGITPVRAVLLAIGVLLIVIFASVALSAAAIAYMAWRISHHNE